MNNLLLNATRLLPILILISGWMGSCSRPRLSDREVRREQIRLNAEAKKRELLTVAGDYIGAVDKDSGGQQDVALHLLVVETPFNENGSIDPVMMPQLSGFLKFPYGTSLQEQDALSFSIKRGEFDPVRSIVELVVQNEKYGEIQLTLNAQDGGFDGQWQALSLSMTGRMTLRRSGGVAATQPGGGTPETPNESFGAIAGTYVGYLNDDARGIHFNATLQLRAVNTTGQGPVLTADVKMARGNLSSEYAVWKFDVVQFHPLTRQVVLRQDGINESFSFVLGHDLLTGDWSSPALGRMGAAVLSRSSKVQSGLPSAPKSSGSYDLCLRSFGGASLTEHGGITLVITPDPANAGKVRSQSSLVFYHGDYGDEMRSTCSLESVEFDYIAGRFQAVCRSLANVEPLVVQGVFGPQGFNGTISASSGLGAHVDAGRCAGAKP